MPIIVNHEKPWVRFAAASVLGLTIVLSNLASMYVMRGESRKNEQLNRDQLDVARANHAILEELAARQRPSTPAAQPSTPAR